MSGTCLLILRGVSPADFLTAPKYVPEAPRVVTSVYTDMPRIFTSVDKWPKSSNRKCWNCDLVPIDYPRFIPVKLFPDGSCETYGHFCEWNCAVRYVQHEMPKDAQWDSLRLIGLYESKFTAKPQREKIPPAPSKTIMRQYCGDGGLSEQEYRERIAALNNEYSLLQYKTDHFSVHSNIIHYTVAHE